MFCPLSLAARIDRAEGRLCAAIAEAGSVASAQHAPLSLPIAGGVAVYAGPDSPMNKLVGVGFDGPIVGPDLAPIEARFATRTARLQAEVSTLADAELPALLCARGYEPLGFENVLGHPLGAHLAPAPLGISITLLTPHEHSAFADTLVTAVASPDLGGVGGDPVPPSDVVRRALLAMLRLPGFRGYIARIGGEIAGAASLRLDGDIAQLIGAGTLPRFRRRGVQSALLRARLADVTGGGCQVAVVVTQPGSKSQENVQREGFQLLYARQLLAKPAPGAATPS